MRYDETFELPGLPRMTNNSGRRNNGWRAKKQEADRWKSMVCQIVASRRPAKPLPRARLTLTRCSSTEPDFDGMVSGFKHVIDGLKLARVIADDKMSVIGQPHYIHEKAIPGHGKIRFRVEAVEPEAGTGPALRPGHEDERNRS